MIRGEVLDAPERRRRWSDEEKSKILEELSQPGVRSADVARRYGDSRSLLYAWRKKLALATGSAPTPGMAFAPVLLAGPAAAPSSEAAAPETPMIEIEVKGARVRLPGSAP